MAYRYPTQPYRMQQHQRPTQPHYAAHTAAQPQLFPTTRPPSSFHPQHHPYSNGAAQNIYQTTVLPGPQQLSYQPAQPVQMVQQPHLPQVSAASQQLYYQRSVPTNFNPDGAVSSGQPMTAQWPGQAPPVQQQYPGQQLASSGAAKPPPRAKKMIAIQDPITGEDVVLPNSADRRDSATGAATSFEVEAVDEKAAVVRQDFKQQVAMAASQQAPAAALAGVVPMTSGQNIAAAPGDQGFAVHAGVPTFNHGISNRILNKHQTAQKNNGTAQHPFFSDNTQQYMFPVGQGSMSQMPAGQVPHLNVATAAQMPGGQATHIPVGQVAQMPVNQVANITAGQVTQIPVGHVITPSAQLYGGSMARPAEGPQRKSTTVSMRDVVPAPDSRHGSVDIAPEAAPKLQEAESVASSEEEVQEAVDSVDVGGAAESGQPLEIASEAEPESSTQAEEEAIVVRAGPTEELNQQTIPEQVETTEQVAEPSCRSPQPVEFTTSEEPRETEESETTGDGAADELVEEPASDEEVAEEEESKAEEKPKLKVPYAEGQWTPDNPTGSRQYTRDFLLQFRHLAVMRPQGLPNIQEISLRDANNSGYQNDFNAMKSFSSHVMKAPFRGPPHRNSGRGSLRGGMRGPPGSGAPVRIVTINRLADVKLHTSDNAWTPSVLQSGEAQASANKSIKRKVTAILNKLTPEKFDRLVEQIMQLVSDIETEEDLNNVIQLVHIKAIQEPSYSVAYAKMCRKLMECKIQVTSETAAATKSGQSVVHSLFRKRILQLCQQEFERELYTTLNVDARRAAISQEKDPEKREALKEELDNDMSKDKKKAVGNIKFVSELFKLQMLTESIIHQIIKTLLEKKVDDSLEILCMLLKTVGRLIDHEKGKSLMDQYFDRLKSLKGKVSVRVGFMILEILEMRQGGWEHGRQVTAAPKTRQQLAEDRLKEEHREQQELSARRLAHGALPRDNRDGRSKQQDDGFTPVASRGPQVQTRYDSNKMKLTKSRIDSNVRLGPPPTAAAWNKGGQTERPSTPQEGNRFAVLRTPRSGSTDKSDSRGGSGRSTPNRADSRDRRMLSGSTSGNLTPRDLRETRDLGRDTVMKAANKLRQDASDRSRSRDSVRSETTTDSRQSPTSTGASRRGSQLTEEQLREKVHSLLDEYMHSHEVAEALALMQELPAASMSSVVSMSLEHVLEKTSRNREMVARLVSDMIKQRTLSVQVFCSGLESLMEVAPDLEVDVPRVYEYMGELLAPLLQAGTLQLDELQGALHKLKEADGKPHELLCAALNDLSKHMGHIKAIEVLAQSQYKLFEFFSGKEEMMSFLEKKDLKWLMESCQSPRRRLSLGSVAPLFEELVQDHASNEAVFDWVEGNVGSSCNKPQFVHMLVAAVFREHIDCSGEGPAFNNHGFMKSRVLLLRRYAESQPLELLFAVQNVAHELEHPPDLLKSMLEFVYNEDLASVEVFKQWQEDESRQMESKGIALQSVRSFLDWLRQEKAS